MRSKIWHILLVLLLFKLAFSPALSAADYFVDCEKALRSNDFPGLRTFYERNKDQPPPEKCFKMNNNEYLVTVADTGRIGQGLYYVNVKENKCKLDEGSYTANIKIEKEFIGKNKKRYVLYSWSNLHGGDWERGYALLFLVPRTEGKSWKTYNLVSVTEDPVVGLCGERIKTGKAGDIKGFSIHEEGTEKVRIVFTVIEQDCKTLKKVTVKKVFVQSGWEFNLER